MEDGFSDEGADLGIQRLCVAIAGAEPGLLASALHSAAFDRFYVVATSDGELAVAPPGIDEIRLIRDLIAVVSQRSPGTSGRSPFILLAVAVGIVRIVGDEFGGAGLCRVQSLVSNAGVAMAALNFALRHCRGESRLVAVLPSSLQVELLADGLAGAWHYVPNADVWLWSADEILAIPAHDESKHQGRAG